MAKFLPLGLGLFLFSSCTPIQYAKEKGLDAIVTFIPTTMVEQLDTQSWNALQRSLKQIKDDEAQQALKTFVSPLIQHASAWGGNNLEWDFYIIDAPEWNAFALPGGTIALNSGLILASESGTEVAGVLGHEVAHVFAKHGLKSMVMNSGVSIAFSLLIGDIGSLAGFAIEKLTGLGLLKFSRDYEREADVLGAKILEKAEYPSAGLVEFFEKLKEKEKKTQNMEGKALEIAKKTISILSTHPMSEERSQKLKEIVSKNPQTGLNVNASSAYKILRSRVSLLSQTQKQNTDY